MVFLPKPGSNSKLCIAFHCPVFHLFCRGVGFVVTRRLRPQALPFNPEIWLRHCLLQGCAVYTGSDPPLFTTRVCLQDFLSPLLLQHSGKIWPDLFPPPKPTLCIRLLHTKKIFLNVCYVPGTGKYNREPS